MPLVRIDWIVVDPHRRAEAGAAIGAAREHHIGPGAEAGRLDAGKHVNIVVGGGPGAVYGQERLSTKSYSIYSALNQAAAEADRSSLIKSWRDASVLGVG